jgi:ArsR family transcriptional regulator
MEMDSALGTLAALAQASRLEIFRTLVPAGPEGMAAGEIAARLGMPGPTLSFHLAQLKAAGLVAVRREGRSLLYSADYAAMKALVAYLLENCCTGRATTCTPPSRRPIPAPRTARDVRSGRDRGDSREASARPRRR